MEQLIKPFKISLDFYKRNIVIVNAKQLDNKARCIEITCTENGKKVVLDNTTTSAFVRYKKADGYHILDEVEIMSDGLVNLYLTQEMLSVYGRNTVDIMLINTTGLSIENVQDIINGIETGFDVSVLSTMSFYIDTQPTAINHSEIAPTYNSDALIDVLSVLTTTEQHIKDLDSTLTENESQRQEAETNRVNAELQREENVENAIKECDIATSNANTATSNANIAITNTEVVTEECIEATSNVNSAIKTCETATANANTAAELCQNIIDQSGIVLQSEKGVANGVATLNENVKISSSQLDIANNLITEIEGKILDATQGKLLSDLIAQLQEQINNLPKIYYGTEEPDNSLGKDGDIYMMIIEETTETVGE